MHIGFITPEYPHPKSTSSGGLGTSIKNLAISLVEKNVRVSVFVYGQEQDLREEEGGIRFHFIKQKKYKVLGWYQYRKYLQRYVNGYVTAEKIDLIEAPDWTGISALMKFSCPLIIRMNGSDAYFCALDGRKQKWKNRFFEKMALKGADGLISVSRFTADTTREIFSLEKPIEIIPNSIDVNRFSTREEEVVPNRILYYGSLIRKKGVLELAKIFNQVIKEVPQAELYLIGKDVQDIFEQRSTLELFRENLSPQATGQVVYIPEVSYAEIGEHIGRAAVVVLPSFAEALPMTWLEAMAMEKALVTSNIGWAKEVMIDRETGYTVDPNDHRAYAGKIVALLNYPRIAEEMGNKARLRIFSKFSTEVVVEKNIEYYKKWLGA